MYNSGSQLCMILVEDLVLNVVVIQNEVRKWYVEFMYIDDER